MSLEIIVWLFLLPMTPAAGPGTVLLAQAPANPVEEYSRGKNAFDRGEYGRAIEILRPLLYPDIRLQSEAQIVTGHRMLGVAHLFEGNEKGAAQEFRKLLQLQPSYRFDPLLAPPQVVDFFNSVLRTHGAEVALLEAKRREAERARERDREECERVRGGPTVIERRMGRNSFALSFVPFGAGQFQNGQRRKGWAFLISEATLASTSLGAFTANLALYGLRPRRQCRYDVSPCPDELIDRSPESASRWLLRTQVATGGLFFAVAIWGVVDAILHFSPESHLQDIPLDSLPAPAAVQLSPVVLPHALGPGLSFRF